ncbi:hypothetical protein M3Y99_00824200 [Aphelenchoides fujianensis]|nr:hypothetical protein M3Y99_00824200 [Aphelenchoides fujianensis]
MQVHCSAGVGRTGTVVALAIIVARLLDKKPFTTNEKKAPLQLVRLAAVFRAQLTSVRRHVSVLKFTLWSSGWHWFMPDVGLGSAAGRVAVSPTEMSGIAKLLRVPVHLLIVDTRGLVHVDWEEMKEVEEFVNGLDLRENPHQFLVLSQFINKVTPQLKKLECSTDVLNHFPPLELNKLQLYGTDGLHEALSRHSIRRLDVYANAVLRAVHAPQPTTIHPLEQLFSPSIKSLELIDYMGLLDVPAETIDVFCRRFPELEDLHLTVHRTEERTLVQDPFQKQWAHLLRLRDRLNIPGLKRLFFVIKDDCTSWLNKPGWMEWLKQTEPFDNSSFLTGRSPHRVRMFLKLSWPTEQLPTFFRIEGEFWNADGDKLEPELLSNSTWFDALKRNDLMIEVLQRGPARPLTTSGVCRNKVSFITPEQLHIYRDLDVEKCLAAEDKAVEEENIMETSTSEAQWWTNRWLSNEAEEFMDVQQEDAARPAMSKLLLVALLGLTAAVLSQEDARQTTCAQNQLFNGEMCTCAPGYFASSNNESMARCEDECEEVYFSFFTYGTCAKGLFDKRPKSDRAFCDTVCGVRLRLWTSIGVFCVFAAAIATLVFTLPLCIATCTSCIHSRKASKHSKRVYNETQASPSKDQQLAMTPYYSPQYASYWPYYHGGR